MIYAAWWLACLLWSSTYVFIRIGLSEVPPWTFAAARLGLALTVLLPISIVRRGLTTIEPRDVVHIMAAGLLLLGVNYALLYWGAQFIPSGLVAILQSMTPVLALAGGWAIGAERLTLRKVAALSLGVLGVVFIFRSEADVSGSTAFAASLAVLSSSACVAAAYVWLKRHGKSIPPLTVTTLQCLSGFIALGTGAFLVEGSPLNAPWSAASMGAAVYLAVCGSIVAFWLNYWLLKRMDASAMLMMGVAEVPIAVWLGAMIFGERLPVGAFTGAACILAGVILTPAVSVDARHDEVLQRQNLKTKI
jgi:drug/metabolite transporter (DMT)-like permease